MLRKQLSSIAMSLYQSIIQTSILLPIVGIFLLTVLLVTPYGEFPLNDDWIHAKAVQRLLEDGYYRGHPYVAATLVAQAYWGAFFCKIFGFSFTTLRISTLVLAVVGGWTVAWSALALGLKRNLALVCGILFAFNPIVLSLSYSFMTDVPFLSLSALSGLCFLWFFRRGDTRLVALGSIFAVIGFLIRQFAIVLPAAFIVTIAIVWWRSKFYPRRSTIVAFAGPWFVGAGLYVWLMSGRENGTPLFLAARTVPVAAMDAVRHFPVALCYMGLFALPLGCGIVWQIKQKYAPWNRRLSLALVSICSLCLAIFGLPKLLNNLRAMRVHSRADWLDAYNYRMPLLPNDYLHDLAVSFPHLHNGHPYPLVQMQAGWWLFTIAALITAGFFCIRSYALVQRVWQARAQAVQIQIEDSQRLFLLIWLLLAFAIIYSPWRSGISDRLLLAGLEPFLLIVAYEMGQYRHRAAMQIATLGTALICIFSVIGVQDYLAWNRTVWYAQDKLMQTYHVPSDVIRGEDTFNGWYNSDKYMQVYHTKDFWQSTLTGLGPWTFDNAYIVTGGETLDGYQPMERFSYFTWLGMQNRTITIFKRNDRP